MNNKVETVLQVSKWAAITDHVKNNRIEYLVLFAILHLLGATDKVYSQVSGVCI